MLVTVSIIVPVYKAELFLERCVRSILRQTYGDWELILIDDGSPDNSGRLCDDFARDNARIKVIHKENGGEASAKNAGIEYAKGDYISICDSDDCVTETGYKLLMERAIETDADVVRGLIREYDENIGVNQIKQRTDSVLRSAMAGHYCNIYSRKMIEQCQIRFQPFVLGADLTFMIQVLNKANNIQRIEDVTYEYIIRPNTSKNKSEIQKQDFKHYYDNFRWREWVVNYMNSSEKLLQMYGMQMGGGLCPIITKEWLKYSKEERVQCFERLKNIVKNIDWEKQKVNENGYLWINKDKFCKMTEPQYTNYLRKRFYLIEPIKKVLGR